MQRAERTGTELISRDDAHTFERRPSHVRMLGPAFTGGCYVVRKGLLSEGTVLGASWLTAARRVYTTSRSRYVRCSFRYGPAHVIRLRCGSLEGPKTATSGTALLWYRPIL